MTNQAPTWGKIARGVIVRVWGKELGCGPSAAFSEPDSETDCCSGLAAFFEADDGSAFEATVRGSAVIALPDATLLVADGWSARALEMGGWLLDRG